MTFDASEFRTLASDLGKGPRALGQLARVAVRKTAKDVQGSAKQIAFAKDVIDTGNLIDKIGTSDLRAVSTSGSIQAEVIASANYSEFNELGTSRMPARPFMSPALDKHAPGFEQAMADIAERAAGGT